MATPRYELCQIRAKLTKPGRPSGTSWNYYTFEAETGSTIIATSQEFTYGNPGDTNWNPAIKRLLLTLTNDGWEIQDHKEAAQGWRLLAYPSHDRTITLRRPIETKDNEENKDHSPVKLLQQLASLKDAGILTEKEFQSKKAEILKRF
jgi:hypothetical protein